MHFENDSALPSVEAPGWRFAVASGILGWILDAFDFFVVVFLLNELMARYNVGKPRLSRPSDSRLPCGPSARFSSEPSPISTAAKAPHRLRRLFLDHHHLLRPGANLHALPDLSLAFTASAWEATGASEPPMRWNPLPAKSAGSFPG